MRLIRTKNRAVARHVLSTGCLLNYFDATQKRDFADFQRCPISNIASPLWITLLLELYLQGLTRKRFVEVVCWLSDNGDHKQKSRFFCWWRGLFCWLTFS